MSLLVLADINGALLKFATFLQTFVGGATALALTVAGYLWMTSEHNPGRRSHAEHLLWAAGIGALIVLLAATIATSITGAIG